MQLSNPGLFKTCSLINNKWITSSSKKTFKVYNSANGEILANVEDCGPAETERAVKAASAAFLPWRGLPAKERAAIMRKWFDLVIQHADDFALLMTAEQGKPLAEAKAEVAYGASFIEWFAEEGKRVYGDVIPAPLPNKRIVTIKQPIGVVAAITPWNFPIAMITRKISPAIAAGCTIVLKPASLTPLCALALGELAILAGFPEGVINIITTTQSAEVGGILSNHPLIRKLSFTGSTAVGKLLMQQCASTVKKVSLELGGNAPLIVFDDADIPLAVKGTLASKYRNAGQTCVCTNRIFVHDKIYKAFMKEYSHEVKKLKVGDGMAEAVQIGPLINKDAVKKVNRLLRDAVNKGATVTLGKEAHLENNLFYKPVIVEGCNAKMALSKEEIFGPVSAIYRFSTEQEAIAMANNTPYGLAAYFFSTNINRIWRVAESLEYGIVGINEGMISFAEAPFGGIKESGIGREGSKYGIEDYLEIKYMCIGGI